MKPMELAPAATQPFRVIGPYAERPKGRLTDEGRALAAAFAEAYRPLRKLAYKKLGVPARRFAFEHGAAALEALCGEAVVAAVRRFQPGRVTPKGVTRALSTVVVVAIRGALSEHYRPRRGPSAAVWTNQQAAHSDHAGGLESDLFARLAAPEPDEGDEAAAAAWARLRERALRQRNPRKRLTPREWHVLHLRYVDGLPSKEAGELMSPPVSKERARQIAVSALAKLRAVADRMNLPLTLPR